MHPICLGLRVLCGDTSFVEHCCNFVLKGHTSFTAASLSLILLVIRRHDSCLPSKSHALGRALNYVVKPLFVETKISATAKTSGIFSVFDCCRVPEGVRSVLKTTESFSAVYRLSQFSEYFIGVHRSFFQGVFCPSKIF